MRDTTGEPESADDRWTLLPDVTRIPLRSLGSPDDSVLDAAIRRLVEDIADQRDITAGFGNVP